MKKDVASRVGACSRIVSEGARVTTQVLLRAKLCGIHENRNYDLAFRSSQPSGFPDEVEVPCVKSTHGRYQNNSLFQRAGRK
jgi:hypothetical protein